jgi:GNAT superfamily N-acetyltransferase
MKSFKEFINETDDLLKPDKNVPEGTKVNLKDIKFENVNLDVIGGGGNVELKNILIARLNKTSIGYIQYTDFRNKAHIDFIFVRKDLRRQGIGKALLNTLLTGNATGTEIGPTGDGYKKSKIVGGFATKEGSKLLTAWEKNIKKADKTI